MAIDEIAERYAPLVVLHDDDKLRPSSAEWFLARSSLCWATGRGLDGTPVPEAEGEVDANRLGSASTNPYSFDGHPASAQTRPLDDHAARGTTPPVAQGFFLRLREEAAATPVGGRRPEAARAEPHRS